MPSTLQVCAVESMSHVDLTMSQVQVAVEFGLKLVRRARSRGSFLRILCGECSVARATQLNAGLLMDPFWGRTLHAVFSQVYSPSRTAIVLQPEE